MWGSFQHCGEDSSEIISSPSLLDPLFEFVAESDQSDETNYSESPSLLDSNSRFNVREYKNDGTKKSTPLPLWNRSAGLPKPSDIKQSSNALLEDFENSLDVLQIIPAEATDHVDYVKKKTADVTSAVVEEAVVKKLLQPYVDRHNVNERTIPLLVDSSRNRLRHSVSVPASPSDLKEYLAAKKPKLSNLADAAESEDDNLLKRSVCFGKLYRMVAALNNETGPRKEAPNFIRSLCQGIMDAINITMDDLTDENEQIVIQAASLIVDLAEKDLETSNLRFSMDDIGIVTLIKCVLNCVEDSSYISKHGGVRNNFAHDVIKSLIMSAKIRTVIFENLCHAVRCCFSRFYVYLMKRSGAEAVIPPAELDGLFHYFQILTMVVLCSSEEPWMEESDVLKLKNLEKIAMTKIPLNLVSIYMTRIAAFAVGKQKKPN